MTNVFNDDWPIDAQLEVRRLRAENSTYRVERNKLRQELAELKGNRPDGLLSLRQTFDALGGDK